MEILIVAATEREILPFMGRNPRADHLITGVGSVMTTYHLTKRLQQMNYDIVIQAGIAGAFDKSIPLSSVVAVESEVFGGSGIMEKGELTSLFEAGLWKEGQPFINGSLINSNPLIDRLPWRKVKSTSSDFLTDDAHTNGQVYAKYKADIESMEGAAFHFVSLTEGVSFLQLRSISNFVGERDKSKWKIEESITALNEALHLLYSELISSYEAKH